MRITTTLLLGALACGATTQAQILITVPDRTPDSEAYTPPPPPPPTPPRPEPPKPQPQEPLPSIVEFDENGKLKVLTEEKNVAALRAFTFDDETWEKLNVVIEERRQAVASTIIQQADTVVSVRERNATLDDTEDSSEVLRLTSFIRSLPPSDVLDRAQRSGALTLVQKRRVTEVIKAYDDAYKEELREGYGEEQAMEIVAAFGKTIFRERILEYMTEFDRMMAETAPNAAQLLNDADAPVARIPRVTGQALTDWWTKHFTTELDADLQTAVLAAAYPELAPKEEESDD